MEQPITAKDVWERLFGQNVLAFKIPGGEEGDHLVMSWGDLEFDTVQQALAFSYVLGSLVMILEETCSRDDATYGIKIASYVPRFEMVRSYLWHITDHYPGGIRFNRMGGGGYDDLTWALCTVLVEALNCDAELKAWAINVRAGHMMGNDLKL